jgi:hypothetical protein
LSFSGFYHKKLIILIIFLVKNMKDIATKVDGDTVDASEWNPSQAECENIVTDTGQTLNASDNYQLSKAASMYAVAGSYFYDSGVINNFILNPQASMKAPVNYITGSKFSFFPSNYNTGASTLSINGLASLPLWKGNMYSPIDLAPNDILPGYLTEVIYIASLPTSYFILNPANYTQIIATSQIPTGTIVASIAPSMPGWVVMTDETIGDASSGATYASAACQNLFITVWNNISDAYAPVSPIGRGGSAESDWEAHKNIQLLYTVGKVLANQMNTIGAPLGSNTASLNSANNGPHTHTFSVHSGYVNNQATPGSSNSSVSGTPSTSSSGSGTSFSIVQPTISLYFHAKL